MLWMDGTASGEDVKPSSALSLLRLFLSTRNVTVVFGSLPDVYKIGTDRLGAMPLLDMYQTKFPEDVRLNIDGSAFVREFRTQ